jgi:DNA modification methylase
MGNRKIQLATQPLTNMLKAKSRHRRQALAGLSRSSVPSSPVRNDLIPKLELVEMDLAELILPPRNVRKIEASHIMQVAASISSLGFCDPVLVDENGGVLDGAVRVEGAKILGLTRIPCIRANHLNPSERRLVRLALNRLGEKGSWDFDELRIELDELILENVPIEITGFSQTEVDQIVLEADPVGTDTGPLAPAPTASPVARIGDVFVMGEHRIICGDSTDPAVLAALMGHEQARLILTDEPYNVPVAGHVTSGSHREFAMASGEMTDAEFQAFNAAWIGACLPHLCDSGIFGSFIDWRGHPALTTAALQLGLAPLNLIVWAKTNAGMGSLYRSQHELLPLFKKGKASHVNNVELGKHGRWRSNVWSYPGASTVGSESRKGLQHHPTVKPVAMLEDALLDVTQRGDIVLDPFLGSGSTLIAAEKTGRCCRGVELDPLYVDVILRRYEAVTGQAGVLESTGEPIAELAERRKHELAKGAAASTSLGTGSGKLKSMMARQEGESTGRSINENGIAAWRSAGPAAVLRGRSTAEAEFGALVAPRGRDATEQPLDGQGAGLAAFDDGLHDVGCQVGKP